MEIKGDNIYVNIKELPVLNQVSPGDLLIIETDSGTNIIDFQDFIITPDNTTFYGEITQLQTDLSDLSSSVYTLSSVVYDVSGQLQTSLNSQISALSADLFAELNSDIIVLQAEVNQNTSDILTVSAAVAAINTSIPVLFSATVSGTNFNPIIPNTSNTGVSGVIAYNVGGYDIQCKPRGNAIDVILPFANPLADANYITSININSPLDLVYDLTPKYSPIRVCNMIKTDSLLSFRLSGVNDSTGTYAITSCSFDVVITTYST